MIRRLGSICLLLLGVLLAALLNLQRPVEGAVFWAGSAGHTPLTEGVRDRDITVCFAGNAIANRLPRIEQIIDYIDNFEQVANIRFYTVTSNQRLHDAFNNNPQALNCPGPTKQPNGFDSYAGDIRIGLPDFILVDGTNIDFNSPIPGYGCGQFNEVMSSDPESVSWDDKRVDVFWRGGWNSVLQHKFGERVPNPNGPGEIWKWKPYTVLGPIASGVAAASTGPNELHLFHVDAGGNLLYRFWDGDPKTWSNNWIKLGEGMKVDATSNPDAISISANRLDVFVRGDDDHLYQFTSIDGGGTWPGKVDRGAGLTSGPAVASWGSNHMEVFARRGDFAIWQKSWDGTNWSGWTSRGGTFSSAPDAVSWGANRIDVVAKGGNNAIFHNTWNGNWSGWTSRGGALASGPAISSTKAGRLDIFAKSVNTGPYYRGLDENGWGNWSNISDSRGGGSWANEPWFLDLPEYRACMYNMRLGNTFVINHTLHEFGHALGLAHEFVHKDTTCWGSKGGATEGLLTPYDVNSVMHYPYSDSTCNAPGDKGSTGLSDWDRLALHILYPEDNRVAEFVGTRVIEVGETLHLRSAWEERGANIDVVVDPDSWSWRLNGEEVSDQSSLSILLDEPGVYVLEIDYVDFLGRDYHYSGEVRVLEEDVYFREVLAPLLEQITLLYPNNVYVPTLDLTLQPDDNVTLAFPSGIADEPIVLDYAPLEQPNPTTREDIGLFYSLDATFLETGQPAELLPGKNYEVTITYDDRDIPTGVAEADLGLYHSEGGEWLLEPTSQVDAPENRVLASPDHFSQWAVLTRLYRYLLPALLAP